MSQPTGVRVRQHVGADAPESVVILPLRNSTQSGATIRPDHPIVVVWLDENINVRSIHHQRGITQLQQIANNISTFTDGRLCIEHIRVITNTKVYMVVSGSLGEHIIGDVDNLPQVESVFIFCRDKRRHETWSCNYPKIKGVFTTMIPIYDALKEAVYQREHNAVPISFMTVNRGLNQLDPSFMYTQILKEILLTIEFQQTHIRDFIRYSRRTFANDIRELKTIRELKKSYHDKSPIWWYTQPCYLYSMLNRSLRLMDGDTMSRMGFFIRDLHQHIQQLHMEQYGDQSSGEVFTVYRGQELSKADFEQMRETESGLMSFNNFLSTTKTREVALDFAEKAKGNTDVVGILFIMRIDSSQSRTPFASIRAVSRFREEEEVLFSMHTVFRIGTIEQMDEHGRLYQVNLTLTSDDDHDLRTLTDLIRQATYPASEGSYRLGLILFKMGHFVKAEEIFQTLLRQTSNGNDKGAIYCQLGKALDAQGKYPKAVRYYKKGIKIYKTVLSLSDLKLALSYNELGNAYYSMGQYSNALSSHETALQIQQKWLAPNHPDMATSFNSIGNIHYTIGDYGRALFSHEKALEIHQQALPYNHPDLAVSYMAIGNVHCSICDFHKSLASHETALDIRQQSLPPNHPDLAASYNNIGVVYERMDEFKRAQSFYERAVEVAQQSLLSEHRNLQISRNNLDRMNKKLFSQCCPSHLVLR